MSPERQVVSPEWWHVPEYRVWECLPEFTTNSPEASPASTPASTPAASPAATPAAPTAATPAATTACSSKSATPDLDHLDG